MNSIQPISFSPVQHQALTALKPIDFDASPLTKFLNSAQRSAIQREAVSVDQVKWFVELIHSPGGMEKISADLQNYARYPAIALRALNEGLIQEVQFGTLCLLYSAIDQMIAHPVRFELKYNIDKEKFDYHPIPISERDPIFKSTIYTFPFQSGSEANILLLNHFPLREEGIELLLTKMQEFPESERYFWAFDCPFGPIYSWSPLFHRLNDQVSFFKAVDKYTTFGPNPYAPHQPQFLIVPSLSMMKAFVSVALPDSHVQLQPALGSLETKDIIECDYSPA